MSLISTDFLNVKKRGELAVGFYRRSARNAKRGISKTFLSVRLSVCQTHALRQNETPFCPYSLTIWKNIYPSFPTWRMVGEDDPCTWNFGPNWPR